MFQPGLFHRSRIQNPGIGSAVTDSPIALSRPKLDADELRSTPVRSPHTIRVIPCLTHEQYVTDVTVPG